MSDENKDNELQTWIEPELEARVVAWVLGEAGEFEAAELERLIAEKPELAIFKRRMEAVHGLVVRASRMELDPMRMAEERRVKLLERLGRKESPPAAAVVAMPRNEARWRIPWGKMVGIAACLLAAVMLVLSISGRASYKGSAKQQIEGAKLAEMAAAGHAGPDMPLTGSMLPPVSVPMSFTAATPLQTERLAALDALKALASKEKDADATQTSDSGAPLALASANSYSGATTVSGGSITTSIDSAGGAAGAGALPSTPAAPAMAANPEAPASAAVAEDATLTAGPVEGQVSAQADAASRKKAENQVEADAIAETAAAPKANGGNAYGVRSLFEKAKADEQAGHSDKTYKDYAEILNRDPYNIAARKGEVAAKANGGQPLYAYEQTRSEQLWDLDSSSEMPGHKFGRRAQPDRQWPAEAATIAGRPATNGGGAAAAEAGSGALANSAPAVSAAELEGKSGDDAEKARQADIAHFPDERAPLNEEYDYVPPDAPRELHDKSREMLASGPSATAQQEAKGAENDLGLSGSAEGSGDGTASAGQFAATITAGALKVKAKDTIGGETVALNTLQPAQADLATRMITAQTQPVAMDAVGVAQKARPRLPVPESGEVSAADQPYSTFSLHVSDVSFLLAKAALAAGQLPDPGSIRPEEFYNAFDYGDPAPGPTEKIACRIEQAAHPMVQQRNLVRIAMKVAATGRGQGQPLRLTVLLDTSGSMERGDRAASVQKAMEVLTSLLGPNDAVTLIGFARQPRLLAEEVPGDQAGKLVQIVKHTPAQGGTNMEEAIKTASELALRHYDAEGQNRVVMLTDGATNLGDADPEQLARLVERLRQRGVSFDACGVGADGLNDDILEALTRKGGGRYYFLNQPEDADGGFARQLAGAFRPAAENVKMQVRFNPDRVGKYRLIGFEKHRLNQEDFRNDKVTAAQLAAEEAAVALYQVQVLPEGEGEIGEVFVRFRDPADGRMIEQSWTIPYDAQAPGLDKASGSMQLAATAALLAEKLRGGPEGDAVDLDALEPIVGKLRGEYAQQARVGDLVAMFEEARRMTGGK